MQNKVPIPAPNEVLNDRKEDIKLEEKKKTQAEIEQEMATLQYTNPQLLEVCELRKIEITPFVNILSTSLVLFLNDTFLLCVCHGVYVDVRRQYSSLI